jgi:serine/threonine protein kinase
VKLGATLNGFTVVTPPTNNDAGMSQWAVAEKDGARYFMKMYLAPKYPTSTAPGSEAGKQRRRLECAAFERRHLAIVNRLRPEAPGAGHLVTTLAFFRVGPSYYKVTRLVDVDDGVDLVDCSPTDRAIAIRSLLVSLKLLHDQGVVHGDLKPENVLFQRTAAGAITSKLIDFDEAYLSGQPPSMASIVGDARFYSPEMLRYVKQQGASASDLTTAADIFALGLLVHVLLTGALPTADDRYAYACEAVNDGATLRLHRDLPDGAVRRSLAAMLQRSPGDRPSIDRLLAELTAEQLRAVPVVHRSPRVGPSATARPGSDVAASAASAAKEPVRPIRVSRPSPPDGDEAKLRSTFGRRSTPPGRP